MNKFIINSASAQTPTQSGGAGAVTAGIRTLGARALVAITVANDGPAAISDAIDGGGGNAWETISTGTGSFTRLYCVRNPITGLSHVFTASNANRAAAIAVVAIGNVHGANAVDGHGEGTHASGGAAVASAFTPADQDVVVVLGGGVDGPSPTILTAGFLVLERLGLLSGQAYGIGIAVKLFTGSSAGVQTPSWTGSAATQFNLHAAAFDVDIVSLNNYQAIIAGDGMSTGERIR